MSLTTLCDTQMPNWRGLLDSEPIDKFLYDPASSILVLTLKTNLLEAWSSWQVLKWPLLTVIVLNLSTAFDGFRQLFDDGERGPFWRLLKASDEFRQLLTSFKKRKTGLFFEEFWRRSTWCRSDDRFESKFGLSSQIENFRHHVNVWRCEGEE